MGVLILVGQLDESIRFYIYVGVLLIGMFYLWKVHRLIFTPKPQKRKALTLSLIGIGFGHAYNGQIVKAFIYSLLIHGVVYAAFYYESRKIFLVGLTLYLISFIATGKNVKFAKLKVRKEIRLKEIKKKLQELVKYKEDGYELAVDTNILMHEPDLLVYLLDHEDMYINLSKSVYKELDGLKNNKSRIVRQQAQLAFDVIEEYQRRERLKMIETPKGEAMKKYGLGHDPDDKIIGTYIKETKGGRKLIFLSNDKGARIIARNAGLSVAEIN
jgi:hypothetical protein